MAYMCFVICQKRKEKRADKNGKTARSKSNRCNSVHTHGTARHGTARHGDNFEAGCQPSLYGAVHLLILLLFPPDEPAFSSGPQQHNEDATVAIDW